MAVQGTIASAFVVVALAGVACRGRDSKKAATSGTVKPQIVTTVSPITSIAASHLPRARLILASAMRPIISASAVFWRVRLRPNRGRHGDRPSKLVVAKKLSLSGRGW